MGQFATAENYIFNLRTCYDATAQLCEARHERDTHRGISVGWVKSGDNQYDKIIGFDGFQPLQL